MSTIDPSTINVNAPATGEATTASVRANEVATRDNFQAAKNDVEALEAHPPLTAAADDVHGAKTYTDGQVLAHNTSGVAHGGVESAYFAHAGSGGAAHSAATGASNGFMSSTDKTKLDNIAENAEVNTVNTVHGRQGDVVGASGDYDGLYAIESTENTTAGALQMAVVATLPGTPDPDTIYFVTTS